MKLKQATNLVSYASYLYCFDYFSSKPLKKIETHLGIDA